MCYWNRRRLPAGGTRPLDLHPSNLYFSLSVSLQSPALMGETRSTCSLLISTTHPLLHSSLLAFLNLLCRSDPPQKNSYFQEVDQKSTCIPDIDDTKIRETLSMEQCDQSERASPLCQHFFNGVSQHQNQRHSLCIIHDLPYTIHRRRTPFTPARTNKTASQLRHRLYSPYGVQTAR